jgi:hypothetical protein
MRYYKPLGSYAALWPLLPQLASVSLMGGTSIDLCFGRVRKMQSLDFITIALQLDNCY